MSLDKTFREAKTKLKEQQEVAAKLGLEFLSRLFDLANEVDPSMRERIFPVMHLYAHAFDSFAENNGFLIHDVYNVRDYFPDRDAGINICVDWFIGEDYEKAGCVVLIPEAYLEATTEEEKEEAVAARLNTLITSPTFPQPEPE